MVGVGWFAGDVGVVNVPSSAHADVEVLRCGVAVDDEDGVIDGEPLAFVDGDGVGEGQVFGGVVGGGGDPAPSVEGVEDHGSVGAVSLDPPAVAVADAPAGGGD